MGFTLAEVLIVVGIIGIVAELTVPDLIYSYQKIYYATALKKSYSEFSDILTQITTEYGCGNNLACTGLFSDSTSTLSLGEAFVKYIKTAKNCEASTDQDCWPVLTNRRYDGSGSGLLGTANYNTGNTTYKFITLDGMSIRINKFTGANADCQYKNATSMLGYMTQGCGSILIDINGPKGPNCTGRDTFSFYITNGKGAALYPEGGVDVGDYWWSNGYCPSKSQDGIYCTGKIIENGWVMDY